jgi:transposase
MSASELRRVGVMERVKAGTLPRGAAAQLLGISYRQAKRIYRRYRAEGAKPASRRSFQTRGRP